MKRVQFACAECLADFCGSCGCQYPVQCSAFLLADGRTVFLQGAYARMGFAVSEPEQRFYQCITLAAWQERATNPRPTMVRARRDDSNWNEPAFVRIAARDYGRLHGATNPKETRA